MRGVGRAGRVYVPVWTQRTGLLSVHSEVVTSPLANATHSVVEVVQYGSDVLASVFGKAAVSDHRCGRRLVVHD